MTFNKPDTTADDERERAMRSLASAAGFEERPDRIGMFLFRRLDEARAQRDAAYSNAITDIAALGCEGKWKCAMWQPSTERCSHGTQCTDAIARAVAMISGITTPR